jgi:glycosyltransferase involved in cell wall biosynthesis
VAIGLVLLAPLAPAATGNGLAMRTELFRRAALPDFDIRAVVVPVGGRLPEGVAAAPHVTVIPDAASTQAGAMTLLADPVWRDRLARAGALPAHAASPALAEAVASAVAGAGPLCLHVMRSYLAPLGAAVAEHLGVEWATLDLDEDEGVAMDRVLAAFGALFDGLSAASAAEAAAVGRRHGLGVTHVPNAVDVPAPRVRNRSSTASLVFVGNLTYPPNVAAATTLACDVLPRLTYPARVTLVGPHDGGLSGLASRDVDVTGFVPDLGAIYASADVAVVALRTGAGTRIKLLEAFAHCVPVVASTVAAAGLECRDGEQLLIADGIDETVAAVERLLADEALAQDLADAAYALVSARYSTEVVIAAIGELFNRAAESARARPARPPRHAPP